MRYGFFTAGLLAAGFFSIGSVQAAQAPRIAVVNLQEVVANSVPGQEANQSLRGLYKKLQGQANDKQQKVKALKTQLDKADSKSKDYSNLLKNYQNNQNDLQQLVLMGRQELEQQREDLLKPIQKELGKVLVEYAKRHHYSFILNQGTGAVYALPEYDVTKGVTAALDADWAKLKKNGSAKK